MVPDEPIGYELTDAGHDELWADPAWAVDSTVHRCCHSIGQHAAGCTVGGTVESVNAPDFLPDGTVDVIDYEPGVSSLIYGPNMLVDGPVGEHVRVQATALVDRHGNVTEPAVATDAGELSPADARTLAAALVAAADHAQQWLAARSARSRSRAAVAASVESVTNRGVTR